MNAQSYNTSICLFYATCNRHIKYQVNIIAKETNVIYYTRKFSFRSSYLICPTVCLLLFLLPCTCNCLSLPYCVVVLPKNVNNAHESFSGHLEFLTNNRSLQVLHDMSVSVGTTVT